MLKDKIIEIEDGVNYYIIEEIDFNNKKYILAAQCDTLNDNVNEEDYIVKEICIENDNLVTKNIMDDNLASDIIEKLVTKVREQ